jgi:hypothetical protein
MNWRVFRTLLAKIYALLQSIGRIFREKQLAVKLSTIIDHILKIFKTPVTKYRLPILAIIIFFLYNIFYYLATGHRPERPEFFTIAGLLVILVAQLLAMVNRVTHSIEAGIQARHL